MAASAGVYTEEIDLSLYASNATETYFGVVGHFSKGPLNDVTLITSYPQLLSYFGTPRASAPYSQAWYACREYLRRGNKLKVVRVESAVTPSAASVSSLRGYVQTTTLETQADGTTVAAAGQLDSALATFQTNHVHKSDILEITVGADVGFYEVDTIPLETRLTVKNVSAWPVGGAGQTYKVYSGKRQSLADGATSTPTLRTFTSAAGRFTAGTDNCNVQAGDVLVIADVGTTEDNGAYVISSVTNATTLVVNRDWPVGSLAALTYEIYTYMAGEENGVTSAAATRTLTSAGHSFATRGVVAGDILVISDVSTPADNGTYIITNVAPTVLTVNQDWPTGGLANLTFRVYPASVKLTAYYKGTYGDNLEAFVTSYTGEPATKFNLEIKESGVQIEKHFGLTYAGIATELASSTAVTAAVIASRGNVPSDHDEDFAGGVDGESGIVAGDYIGTTAAKGLQLFRSAVSEECDILAVPGQHAQAVGDELIAIGEERKDLIAVCDPPDDGTVDTAIESVQWHNGTGGFGRTTALSSSYAATYWPWVKVYDEYNSAYRWTAPSGHAAAAMTHTDNIAYPWWAPAGGSRGKLIGASGVFTTPTQGERDYMQGGTNCVNPIVNFPGEGVMVYGQKTCYRYTTALNRLNVRRMVSWLSKNGSQSLRSIVFDPNDATTWDMCKDVLNPLCRYVKKHRGLNDFLVVCDDTNNTTITISNYQLIIDVYLKPTLAAEIIKLRFTLTAQDANFSELMGT